MIRRPPRSTRTYTLFPYTTLFRSGSDVRHSLPLQFSAVVIIVPEDDKVDAINAANKAGASGVTVLNADGIGLEEMGNFYRTSFEATDSLLLFLLPQHQVNDVLKSIIHSLHLTTSGKGVAFAFPLTHMKGISLSKEAIFKEKAYQIDISKELEEKEVKLKNDDSSK